MFWQRSVSVLSDAVIFLSSVVVLTTNNNFLIVLLLHSVSDVIFIRVWMQLQTLLLYRDFYNIIFKVRHTLNLSSEPASPPSPNEKFRVAPVTVRVMCINCSRSCPSHFRGLISFAADQISLQRSSIVWFGSTDWSGMLQAFQKHPHPHLPFLINICWLKFILDYCSSILFLELSWWSW